MIHIQRPIISKIGYRSDPSRKVINLLKISFSSDNFELLNKNVHFAPTTKELIRKQQNSFSCYKTKIISNIAF